MGGAEGRKASKAPKDENEGFQGFKASKGEDEGALKASGEDEGGQDFEGKCCRTRNWEELRPLQPPTNETSPRQLACQACPHKKDKPHRNALGGLKRRKNEVKRT